MLPTLNLLAMKSTASLALPAAPALWQGVVEEEKRETIGAEMPTVKDKTKRRYLDLPFFL